MWFKSILRLISCITILLPFVFLTSCILFIKIITWLRIIDTDCAAVITIFISATHTLNDLLYLIRLVIHHWRILPRYCSTSFSSNILNLCTSCYLLAYCIKRIPFVLHFIIGVMVNLMVSNLNVSILDSSRHIYYIWSLQIRKTVI